jgi:hypothetical protein
MLKAVLRQGAIIPTEALPPEWEDGAVLEVTMSQAPPLDIDNWTELMNQLCADSEADDEKAMRDSIEEQRQQAKAQTRRDMGLPA